MTAVTPISVTTEALPSLIRAVLFDLDGTLVDSAPDLAGATNEMLLARGLPEVPFEQLRPMVGAGARGMMGIAFNVGPMETAFPALRDEFFDRYEQRLLRATRPFDDVEAMLETLRADGFSWGIVTNKSERFALPLAQGLGWAARAAAVVGGDTTPFSKPRPEPLLEAARRAGVSAAECVYVGDDARDILAGRAAGMPTVAVRWGYLGQGEPIDAWGADVVIDTPAQLIDWLRNKNAAVEVLKSGALA
ncbi:MAG: phosphoglycolate phosphatase [Mitsuaria chitosanitabida]|jgi:phosphoglycolate phosphatase|uniref:phosphoglycolate phosphatase n=1 Tax=Roseateles chitosanitabidus TaxID=65048 RepID=UPI001B217811|nr:phosphoglycolate phosphatase [Roseateles chitosanitabidus]MBO9685266.1 phosphoglycolate phosphatase [Roseateles chitosanitabidus]